MLRTLDAANRRLLLLLVLMFLMVGSTFTIVGAALPQIIRTFHWSYTLTGLVLMASAGGYVLGSFTSGFLVERFPPRRIIVTGLVVGSAGLALFARTSSPWLNMLFSLAIGMYQGSVETVMNAELVRMEPSGQSRLMNFAHSFFCVGAILGPLSVGSLVDRGLGPALIVFAAAGGISALLALVFVLTPLPRATARTAAERGTLRLLRDPLLLILVLFLLLYVGAELGVTAWVSEFFVTELGTTAASGAYIVSLFWAGMLVGRLVISYAYHGMRQERIVLALTLLSAASLLAALLAGSPVVAAAGIFATGLGFSGMYPLVMAMVGRIFKSGVAVGAAATGGGIGSLTFPFLMAVLAQGSGMRGGFWFYTGLTGTLVLLALVIVRRVRSAVCR